MQYIHQKSHQWLVELGTKYMQVMDEKQRSMEFDIGDLVCAILIKDHFLAGEFNKLSTWKISLLEIIEKINPNAYLLKLPTDIRTTEGFNVKHLIPYNGDNSSLDEDATIWAWNLL